MGNYNTRAVKDSIIFCQSLTDFPCPVTLGRVAPSFGLHRFKHDLRFVPTDDEGFTLRGDKRRLLYKGRKKSHRFTILGDTSFEYDCILLKEPESNIITLRMEGAENFDFFRQPDFIREPFLKGSYAVYKKDILVGEGTGKLCHIHRPELIDARGRRCWGELAIVGNKLHIIIPEKWLADAKYPVVVDPTVGTTTIGSQTEYYYANDDYWYDALLELDIVVNRYLLNDTLNGTATAYVYTYDIDSEGDCVPLLYSDNSNVPLTRRSINEGVIDIEVTRNKPAGWRQANFSTNTSIAAGNYIWLGIYAFFFYFRFDYANKAYYTGYNYVPQSFPNTFPVPNVNDYYNHKVSLYFTFTVSQNYVRTLTQGVKLTDTRRLTGNYYRKSTQTVNINSFLKIFETFYRKCIMTVYNTMNLNRLPVFIRNVTENINVTMDFFQSLLFARKCNDDVNANSQNGRIFNVIRIIHDNLNFTDNNSISILYLRRVPDSVNVTHTFEHWGDFIRSLKINAGNIAETEHKANYKRFTTDSVNAVGTVFRALFMYVRIISKIVLRDYILRRFLKAKEDFILKSPISRELKLDSRID